jgi:hypothetical protein
MRQLANPSDLKKANIKFPNRMQRSVLLTHFEESPKRPLTLKNLTLSNPGWDGLNQKITFFT